MGASEPLANDTCLSCHGDVSSERFVDAAQFSQSVHGALACVSCHSDVTTIPHEAPLRSVHWQHIPETCGACHADIQEQFARSSHGKAVASGRRGAPVCTDCHGIHNIRAVKTPASSVFPSHIPDTCGQCHAAQRIITKFRLPPGVVTTYQDSYHGLANQLGSIAVANCASCHGAHAILPSTDPQSSITPQNLPKTCGRCHPGVGSRVAEGRVHAGAAPHRQEHPAVTIVRRFYLWLIFAALGAMALHNLLDFLSKVRRHRQRMLTEGQPGRMSLNRRIQHAILLLTFTALAYTGFTLKFPHAWWASPMVGHTDWRSLGHRASAAVFCGLGLYHLWFITCTRRGRHHLAALRPRLADVIQPWQMLAYYLGWRSGRPLFARYSYVEKLEYWALVWGSVVMAVTGTLMAQQRWTLRVFPKWFFDVVTTVHYYEAVLACLAILIWHGYFTIFDPDEYPMKWTWMSGRGSPADRIHRREHGRPAPPQDPAGR